jgi:hypothetical protein
LMILMNSPSLSAVPASPAHGSGHPSGEPMVDAIEVGP